jgi:hypothetical protein
LSLSPLKLILSLGVKRQGREADHSPPSSAEVKKGGAIPSLPICLHGVVLDYLSTGKTLIFINEHTGSSDIASDFISG